MENDPIVSYIIPVYNVEKYLERCINSLLEQTYSNIEILLVDDGSTDESGKICNQYAEKYPNIQVYHLKNGDFCLNFSHFFLCGPWCACGGQRTNLRS